MSRAREIALTAATLGALLLVGCGGVVKQVRGATFDLSGREASVAEPFEQEEPKRAPEDQLCTYWSDRAADARGSHTVGILNWPAEYFETLRSWVAAKRDEHCSAAAQQKELAAKAQRADEAVQRTRDAADEQRRYDERMRLKRAVIRNEIATGRCEQDHVEELRDAVRQTKALVSGQFSRETWTLVDHELLVPPGAKPEDKKLGESALTLKVALGGEHHVVILGVAKELELDVIAADGYPVRSESPIGDMLVGLVRNSAPSRVFEARTGENVNVKVRGFGCVALMVFRRL
jgi:hypothetical protein